MAEITVDYVEMTTPPDEGVDDQGLYATKEYGVLWADRFTFCRDILGVSSQSGGVGGSWNRKIPLSYPDDPLIYARTVRIKPNGAWSRTTPLSFPQAIIGVTFRAPDWNVTTNDDPLFLNSFSQDSTENAGLNYATQEIDFGAEWISVPTSNATYASSGEKVKTSISRRVVVARMVLTYHKLPFLPMGKLIDYSDVLNNDTFLGRPRGTVMLEGGKTIRDRDAAGTITQKLTMTLKTRKHDWNDTMLDDGTWDTVIFDGDSTKTLYPYIDMKPILFVGS